MFKIMLNYNNFYSFPMPLPRAYASDYCQAFLFDDHACPSTQSNSISTNSIQPEDQPQSKSLIYPFPVSEEIWADLPFPISLCIFGNACPIKVEEIKQSKSAIIACPVCMLLGCPLFLLDFSEFVSFAECKNVEIFDFSAPEGKQFEKDADTIVANFNKLGKYHRAPIIVLGHDEDQEFLTKEGLPAAGIIANVKKLGSKLFSDFIDVPKKIADLINLGAYRFVSSEIYKNFFFNGEFIGPVLRRVALLGADVPKIKGLDDILARYSDSDQILVWIKKKGEPFMKKQIFEFKDISGSFQKGDKVTSGDANGEISEIKDSTYTINCESEKEFRAGIKIVGPNGTANLGELYPYPVPEKKAESAAQSTTTSALPISSSPTSTFQSPTSALPSNTSLNAETQRLLAEKDKQIAELLNAAKSQNVSTNAETLRLLSEKDKQIAELAKFSSQLQSDVTTIKSQLDKEKLEKESSLRISHAKEVEMFCERLKNDPINLAPAFVDELGFRSFAMALDWQRVFKFSESEPEKTPWAKFSEIISLFAKAGKEGKLHVPTARLTEGEENELGEFVPMDQQALNMDRLISSFAEKNKVSYEQAFNELNRTGKLYNQ